MKKQKSISLEEIILMEAHCIEPRCSKIHNIRALKIWWFENSIPNVINYLKDDEINHIRRRTWEMLTYSCNKIYLFNTIVDEALSEIAIEFPEKDFFSYTTFTIIGSIAKIEAESKSDLEIDMYYDDDKSPYIDVIKVANSSTTIFQKLMQEHQKHTSFDIVICCPTSKLVNELKGDYDFLQNIFLTGRCIYNIAFYKFIIKTLVKKISIEKLMLARQRLRDNEIKKINPRFFRVEPRVKVVYHSMSYGSQIIFLKFIIDGKFSKRYLTDLIQPYWKIIDFCKGEIEKIDPSYWGNIVNYIPVAMNIREYPQNPQSMRDAMERMHKFNHIVNALIVQKA